MGLTSEKALIEINKLFDLCFEANAMADRMVYELDIKFNCPKFSEWLHHKIAHLFPIWSDKIQEYGSLRGDIFYRGMIPEQKQDYLNISSLLETLTMKVVEIERQCIKALHISAETDSEGYEDWLRSFSVENISPLIKQATVLYTMAKDYENSGNAYKINKDFDAWIIPQFKGDD